MPLIFPSIVNKKNFACNRVNDKSANVRQKLNMMETALSYLTTNKWQLNSSAEKARFDIRKTTEQKITMLREQEYKLVEEVDHLLQHEQQRLEEQIENLNQAIGTCKFVVGKEYAFVDENGLEELISAELEQRINLLAKMANSSECANIVFNANFSERNCQQSATIGQIFVEFSDGPLSQHLIKPNHLDNFTSSPYDNWLMPQRHLSRNRSSNSTCSSDDTAQAEEQPPNNGANIRDRLTSTTSLSVASFDVISAGGCLNGGGGVTDHFGTSVPLTVFSQQHQLQTNSFAAYFRELNCLPIDHWLWPSSTANGSKKGTPIAAGAVPSPQHSFLPNNIAEMFSKINMDTNERQLQQQHHHSFSSASINSVAKNHQKAQPRKRSVGADGNGNQLGGQPNDGTTNWAKAELSFWLKASKGVPSSAVSSANVINSVMASARDQWLLAAPATANNPITLSTSVRDAAAVLQPPDAKIARHQTHGAPFVISKNAQQLLDINKNKNSELPTLAELEEDTLDKLAKKFEMNAYIKPTEHFVHPTNISKHFHFSSRTNGDAIGSGADTAVAPTNADQQDHDASHTTLLSPLSVEDDETKGNSQSALEMSKTTKPLLALPTDPSHWLKRYPPPKQNRPMNEMAEDLYCWESVLGWKSILEKIHGSGEDGWLAPSSRAIKNTSTE